MTINVAIKSSEGIVMGSDSLLTISTNGQRTAMVPYHYKLFPMGKFPAGIMLNGSGSIGQRTIADLISEYVSKSTIDLENFRLEDLAQEILDFINEKIIEYYGIYHNFPSNMELIIGGFSKGTYASEVRSGQIFSLRWEGSQKGSKKSIYQNDEEFGYHYGGQPQALDRFLYGIDDQILKEIYDNSQTIFDKAKKEVLNQINQLVDDEIQDLDIDEIKCPDQFILDIYDTISNYDKQNPSTIQELFDNVKLGMNQKFQVMNRFLSLQMSIGFCEFLMLCAYAVNNYTYRYPSVGSQMTIATITRSDGFNFVRKWIPTASNHISI